MKELRQRTGFKVIGKSWQVRAHLRQLAKHPLTVKQYVERNPHFSSW